MGDADGPWVLGLMSGTSLDGIDAALIKTDGRLRVETGPFRYQGYDDGFRARLRTLLGRAAEPSAEFAAVERELTLRHAEAVRALLEDAAVPAPEVALIGFPAHTLLHDPAAGRSWQIGDGALLAAETGIDVVCDFRSRDMAEGGQGAPFAPLFHAALAAGLERPLAVLNLGGVANVTWIGSEIGPGEALEGGLLGFDTGPGNALLDDWVLQHLGRPYDAEGALAASGQVAPEALRRLLAHPYFALPPPKALDRDAFDPGPLGGLSAADGAATLVAFTAQSVARAARHFPAPVGRWLVTGGGRHNPAIMAALRAALEVAVEPVEAVGWQGDALEAQAFGYLALRSREGLPLSLPATTGVARPVSGGRFCPAEGEG